MGNVILLQEKWSAKPARQFAPGHSAEIIIFQGVRFERLTDDMIEQSRLRGRRLPSLQNHAMAEDWE
jgi:hypothetical protein